MPPTRIASSVRSSGTPSATLLIRSGHSMAIAASAIHPAVFGLRPALARRRQVEEPGGEFREIGVRPRHDGGARRIDSAPIGPKVPRMRRAAGVDCVRTRWLEPQAPSLLHERRGADCFPSQQRKDARAREACPQELAMKDAERRKDAADENRFERAIERHAVGDAADSIGPQQGDRSERDPPGGLRGLCCLCGLCVDRHGRRISSHSPTCTPTGRISALPAT